MFSTENEIQIGLLSLYKKELPSRKNMRIIDLTRISDGWENDVYSFTVEYEEATEQNREDLILRIYPGDDAVEKSAKEFNAMKQLHEIGYPVPRVYVLEQDVSYFGKPFVVMEKINGRLMGDIIVESPKEKQQELLTLFCKMFVELHNLDWRPFVPDPSLYTKRNLDTIINQKLLHWHEYVHSFQKNEFDPVFSWLKDRISNIRWERLSVIHWDYHPWNILMRDDGAALVIDWTSTEVLDFRFDLAWTILLMSTHWHPEAPDVILNEYERIAGFRIEHIDIFEVAACLRRLFSISVSFSHGAEKMGMRPGAETMMKQHAVALKSVYAFMVDRTGITIPEIEKLLSTLS